MAAAMGLGVTDLSIQDIAEVLIGVINGNDSGTTGASLPTQSGWMWADPAGNTWLQTYKVDASGTTQLVPSLLFSATGGWYTHRWYGPDAAGSADQPLNLGQLCWADAASDATEAFGYNRSFADTDVVGGGCVGRFGPDASPAASGAHHNLVGRGFSPAFLNLTIAREPPFGNQDYALFNNAVTDQWTQSDDPQNLRTEATYQGMVASSGIQGYDPGGNWPDPHWAYFFGHDVYGNLS
jgi:hypothetical protein